MTYSDQKIELFSDLDSAFHGGRHDLQWPPTKSQTFAKSMTDLDSRSYCFTMTCDKAKPAHIELTVILHET